MRVTRRTRERRGVVWNLRRGGRGRRGRNEALGGTGKQEEEEEKRLGGWWSWFGTLEEIGDERFWVILFGFVQYKFTFMILKF